jgi:hypothetical protein
MVRDYIHISIAGRLGQFAKHFVLFSDMYGKLLCSVKLLREYVKAFSIIIDFDIYSLFMMFFL